MDQAWEFLQNASIFRASIEVYEVAWGVWFWPILFLFTLFVMYIKTESPAYVVIFAILGNVALATLLTPISYKIFTITIILSLVLVLWSFIGSSKID